MPTILALDFGGSKHTASLVNWPLDVHGMPSRDSWRSRQCQISPAEADCKLDIQIMMGLAHSILEGETALAVGVSFGGPVEASANTVRQAARRTALPEVEFQIFPVALGDDAPLWGAVALAETCLLTLS
jgi:hypothetical protein